MRALTMPQTTQKKKAARRAQRQHRQPGLESRMRPLPQSEVRVPPATPKLHGKVALITGSRGTGTSALAVALAFAAGADVAVLYLNEHDDARETVRLVELENRRAIAIAGDVGNEAFCKRAVTRR